MGARASAGSSPASPGSSGGGLEGATGGLHSRRPREGVWRSNELQGTAAAQRSPAELVTVTEGAHEG